ncbi:zinc finger MYM-type protein 1-like [Aphis craccivora]|uniref:Zinc finger MYM-type protein 1-like n=1 Tax=Aphis craccivora TaxID=307492 RepID=A0A6G0Y9A1_APHCR|nr:zinc finger MYM-type protein 1-like [Aphis craccivora]
MIIELLIYTHCYHNASAMLEPHTSKNTSVSVQVNSNPEFSSSINTVPTLTINYTPNECESYPDLLNLGFYNNESNLSDELKYKLLTKPYVSSDNYDFKNDKWLKQYGWLVYSRHLKGGLYKHCNVFRPVVKRELLRAFIVSKFTKYKDFHFHAKKHMQSEWHRDSVSQTTDFLKIMSNKEKSVIDQLNTAQNSQIEQNRKKLVPILSSIIFCATHDLAIISLSCSGNFHDLLKFRVQSRRRVHIGFSALQTLDAVGIATFILTSVKKYGLDMNKLVGLGFNGNIFSLSSHRLNVVVKDLNAVTEIQNTVGVIKESVLEKPSHNNDSDFKANTTTGTKAHQLSCATSTS